MKKSPKNKKYPYGLTDIVDRNILALMKVRQEEDERRTLHQRAADLIGEFTGSIPFVYLHLILFGGWLVVNLGLIPGIKPWDPFPFVMLAMIASVEAIFLSTFVLINQNRMARISETRADLDLQISLLTEHELTRLINMVDTIANRLGAVQDKPGDLDDIKKDIPADIVLERIEEVKQSGLEPN